MSGHTFTGASVGGPRESPPPAHLIIDLFDEIARGRGHYVSLFERLFEANGLNELDRLVLTAVVAAPHPPTIPQIARSHGLVRQTILRHANSLAARGLIRFVDNPDHKLAHQIVATPAGITWRRQTNRRALEWATKFTEGINHEQLANAVTTLRLVRKQLEAEARAGRRPTSRPRRRGASEARPGSST
jgi:DNA-binding MarR family transcriptional regulator